MRAHFAGCVLPALLLCSASALAQNMLVNPGFESGPTVIGTFLSLNAGSTAMPGWIVTRGQIDIVTSGWQQIEGLRSLDLNGSPGAGGVAQTFATTPSRDYTVSFYLAGNPGATPAIKTLKIAVVGQNPSIQFDNTNTSFANMHWTKYIYGFRAINTSTTLEFYSGDPSSFGGAALDNVVVRPADCVADLNYDGYVDDSDFPLFLTEYNQLICNTLTCFSDFNHDGLIDDADFVIFAAAYNQLLCP